jgi:hypothetical protein
VARRAAAAAAAAAAPEEPGEALWRCAAACRGDAAAAAQRVSCWIAWNSACSSSRERDGMPPRCSRSAPAAALLCARLLLRSARPRHYPDPTLQNQILGMIYSRRNS